MTARPDPLDVGRPDPRLVDAARARAAGLADEIEADALDRAVAQVRERLTGEYAHVLEQAVLEELAARARERADARAARSTTQPEPPAPTSRPTAAPESGPVAATVPPGPPTAPESEPLGWYLYALVRRPNPDLGGELGLDPAFGVEMIGDDDLAAVGSRTRLSLLQAGQEGADLSPDGWLATALRRHEQLVEMAGETVVPMRFGTVYPDADRIRALLDRNRDVVLDELHRLADQTEWGVKLIATRPLSSPQPEPQPQPQPEPDVAVPVSGAGYLRRKAESRTNARAVSEARRELVAAVHEQLAARATGAVVTPVQRTGSDTDAVLLNASYLVHADQLAGFHQAVSQVAESGREDGREVQLTGPWPPYHFVRLVLADDSGPR